MAVHFPPDAWEFVSRLCAAFGHRPIVSEAADIVYRASRGSSDPVILSNLAICYEMCRRTDMANRLYSQLLKTGTGIPGSQKEGWFKVMVVNADHHLGLMKQRPADVDNLIYFLRMFAFDNDRDNLQKLEEYIAGGNFSRDGWVRLIEVSALAGEKDISARIARAARSHYPEIGGSTVR